MKVQELRKKASKKPVVLAAVPLKSLVRQLIVSRMPSSKLPAAEMPKKRKGIGLRVCPQPKGDSSEDCSNKHVSTNPSTTPQLIHEHIDNSHVENKSVNTNLITEEIAKRFSLHSATNPHVNAGFCDRLAMTFGGHDLESLAFFSAVDDLKVKDGNDPYLRAAKPKKSSYRMNFWICSPSGMKLAQLQIQPKRAKMRFARLHFNPAAIGEHGVCEVRQMLRMLFGESFREVLANGRITQLDSTVDVYGFNVGDVLMYTANPRASTLYKRCFPKKGVEEWQLGSLYLGAEDSGNRVRTYDKAVQLYECKGVLSEGPISRIEATYKPAKVGGRKKPKSVADVLAAPNPFAQIKMAYYPSPMPSDPMFEFFLYAAKDIGVNAALQKITNDNKRTAFRKAMAKSSPDWWQPQRYWSEVLEHIESLDLLPKELFKKKLRLLPDE